MAADIVVGPWSGSNPYGIMPAQPAPARRPIPHRYRVGKHGPTVLMDCRECRRPWAPEVEVPRDRLCNECRADADLATPTLDLGELQDRP